MRLRANRRCPIHGGFGCCGRPARAERLQQKRTFRAMRKPSSTSRWYLVAPGVHRIDDPHHPRGFRERRSRAAMCELILRKVVEQKKLCGICGEPMTDMENVTDDHIDPKGMGGAWRDDHPDNIQAVHHNPCNLEKGSKRYGMQLPARTA